MAAAQPRPAQHDLACESAWESELFSLQLFESPAGNATRSAVISWLEALISGVSALIGVEQGLTVTEVAAAGTRIFPFGSCREGVHGPQSDLDLLVLCPAHVSRDAFFALVPTLLLACSREGATPPGGFVPSFVQALPDAFVPVIKLGVGGLQIDLLYARLPLPRFPPALMSAALPVTSPTPQSRVAPDSAPAAPAPAPAPGSSPSPLLGILDDALSRRLASDDPKSGLSLNGVRVTERILAALPAPADMRAFQARGRASVCLRVSEVPPSPLILQRQLALVALKTWAKARGLYGHVLGYPGGVAWAIIVATVAQVRLDTCDGGGGGIAAQLRASR